MPIIHLRTSKIKLPSRNYIAQEFSPDETPSRRLHFDLGDDNIGGGCMILEDYCI
jgi:hypothetical protein